MHSATQLLGTVEGFEYLAISDPSQKKGFGRVGWAQYRDGTDMDQVIKTLDGATVSSARSPPRTSGQADRVCSSATLPST